MIFDILGKSRHHQALLRKYILENDPPKNMGNWETLNFRENGFHGLPPNLQPLREDHARTGGDDTAIVARPTSYPSQSMLQVL